MQLAYERGDLQRVPRKAYVVVEVPEQHVVVTAFVCLDGTPAVDSWEGVRAQWVLPHTPMCEQQAWLDADRSQNAVLPQARGVQAMVSSDDTFLAEELVLGSPKVQRLLRERYGITDMSLVVCDPWYYGER